MHDSESSNPQGLEGNMYHELIEISHMVGVYFVYNHDSHRNAKRDAAWVNRLISFDSLYRFSLAALRLAKKPPIQFCVTA